jgi:hypothetical protein
MFVHGTMVWYGIAVQLMHVCVYVCMCNLSPQLVSIIFCVTGSYQLSGIYLVSHLPVLPSQVKSSQQKQKWLVVIAVYSVGQHQQKKQN